MSPRASGQPRPALRRRQDIEAMIRVDHAGEYGAVRIYEGQLAVFDALKAPRKPLTRSAPWRSRERHLKTFDRLVSNGTFARPRWSRYGGSPALRSAPRRR